MQGPVSRVHICRNLKQHYTRILILFLSVFGFVVTSSAQTTSSGSQFSEIQSALGVSGMIQNNVLEVDFSRNDLSLSLNGKAVSPELFAHGEFAFWMLPSGAITAPTGTSIGSTGPGGVAIPAQPSPNGQYFMMTAEIPLLPSEVAKVTKALQTQDVKISALHNHEISESPRLMFMHLEAIGSAANLGAAAKAVIGATAIQLRDTTPTETVAGLNTSQLQSILGGPGEAESGSKVFDVRIPRAEQFTTCAPASFQVRLNGGASTSGSGNAGSTSGSSGSSSSAFTSAEFQAETACQVATLQGLKLAPWANGDFTQSVSTSSASAASGVAIPWELGTFSEVAIESAGSSGQAIVNGEFALFTPEIEPTIRALTQQGFSISAVHNHQVSIVPQLWFVHFSQTGDSIQLATKLRAIMDENRAVSNQLNQSGTSTGTATGTSGSGGGGQ